MMVTTVIFTSSFAVISGSKLLAESTSLSPLSNVTPWLVILSSSLFPQRSFCLFVEFGMEGNSKVEVVTMTWYSYLLQIIVGLLSLFVLKIIYFSIKRRYKQTSIVEQSSTEESEIYTSSENIFNEFSSERLDLELEKKNKLLDKINESLEVLCSNGPELSKLIDTEDNYDDELFSDLLHFNTTMKLDFKKTIDKVYSGYDSTKDEMQECKNHLKFQDVVDTCKINSGSLSSILSWKSCHKDINYSESGYVNNSENLEICQPINLCIKDDNNKIETYKQKTKTFFTDRKYKNTKDILMKNPENYFYADTIEDKQHVLKVRKKLKNEYDILKYTKIHLSLFQDKSKNLDYLCDKEYSLNTGKPEYNMQNTEYGLEHENHLKITKLSTNNHNELENEGNLNDTEHFSNYHNELEAEYNENIKHELENECNLNNTELSIINYNELENECNFENIEYSLNEDELMLEKNLETTEISILNQGEPLYEYNLESPELSSLNNDKSISGIDSPNINCNHDYEVQDITDLNNTSSTEFTESLPSPIYQNNNSIDDIRYVEDYNDISFFDPTLSDDAMNEAFVED